MQLSLKSTLKQTFVARNEGFQELVKEIANQVLDTKAETVEALMEGNFTNGKIS